MPNQMHGSGKPLGSKVLRVSSSKHKLLRRVGTQVRLWTWVKSGGLGQLGEQ